MGKAILFSAPSGCGKTTIIKELMASAPKGSFRPSNLSFSISATSRAPRGEEVDGKDYYFLSHEEFKARVERDEFLEWEEVYSGMWAYVSVTFYAYDVNGNKGIACGLNNIMKFKDDERLGGRVSAECDFDGVGGDDDEEFE